jgi:hypothetical protein
VESARVPDGRAPWTDLQVVDSGGAVVDVGRSDGTPCHGEGEVFSAKVAKPIGCCDGLVAVNHAGLADSGTGCVLHSLNGEVKICTQCGNGLCGLGENVCNCSVDCP